MRENFTYGLMKGALIALSIIIFNQILIDRAIRLYSTEQAFIYTGQTFVEREHKR